MNIERKEKVEVMWHQYRPAAQFLGLSEAKFEWKKISTHLIDPSQSIKKLFIISRKSKKAKLRRE